MAIRSNKDGTTYTLDFKRKGYPRLRKAFGSYNKALIMEANLKALIADGRTPEYVQAFFTNNGITKEPGEAKANREAWDILRKIGEAHYSETKNWKDGTAQTKEAIGFLQLLTPLSLVNESHVDAFVEHLQDRGLNPKTINRKLSTLSVLLKKAKRKHMIDAMPVIERLKESEGRMVYYTDEMLEDFFRTLSLSSYADLTPVYWFLLDTGCRTGELEKFDINDNESVTFYNTKSGKARTVPLTQRLKDYLAVQDPADPFPTLTKVRLRKSFETARDELGWSREYVRHTFRHTCATRLVKAGVHITAVKEWMGHANINTTMIYIQFSKDHLKDAVKALEAL